MVTHLYVVSALHFGKKEEQKEGVGEGGRGKGRSKVEANR